MRELNSEETFLIGFIVITVCALILLTQIAGCCREQDRQRFLIKALELQQPAAKEQER